MKSKTKSYFSFPHSTVLDPLFGQKIEEFKFFNFSTVSSKFLIITNHQKWHPKPQKKPVIKLRIFDFKTQTNGRKGFAN